MVIWRWTVGLLVTGLLFVTAINVAAQGNADFDIRPLDRWGTPCTDDRSVPPTGHYCDMEIVPQTGDWRDEHCSDSRFDTKLDRTTGPIAIYVDGELTDDWSVVTKSGCELWFHPDNIYHKYGSVTVRIDWYPNQSYAFTVADDHNDEVMAESLAGSDPGSFFPGGMVSWNGTVWVWDTIVVDSQGRCLDDNGLPVGSAGMYATPVPGFMTAWTGDYWDHDNNSATPVVELADGAVIYTCSF